MSEYLDCIVHDIFVLKLFICHFFYMNDVADGDYRLAFLFPIFYFACCENVGDVPAFSG